MALVASKSDRCGPAPAARAVIQRGLESRRFRQYENCRDLVKRRNLAFFSAEFIYFIDQLRSTAVFNGVAHATLCGRRESVAQIPQRANLRYWSNEIQSCSA